MSLLQVQKNTTGSIASLGAVVFDETVLNDGDILYDPVNGIITISSNGTYVFDWWVSTQNVKGANVRFNLSFSSGKEYISNSPIKTGNTEGIAIIEITEAPVTVSLQNVSNSDVFLASISVTSSLRVFTINVSSFDTASECFAYRQLVNVLEQFLVTYPGTIVEVFCDQFQSFNGQMVTLHQSPDSDIPSLLVMADGVNYYYISIEKILYFEVTGITYDNSFNYLPLPDPFVETCNNAIIRGYYEMLGSVSGNSINAYISLDTISGELLANEYGMLVLGEPDNSAPKFLVTTKITAID